MRAILRLAFAASLILPAAPALAQLARAYTVYAAGDIAQCVLNRPSWSFAARTARVVARALADDQNAAALTLGDHVYEDGTAQEFADCYDPTWGQFKARTWPAPGNHDYYTDNAAPYFAYFGERASRGYYSLRLGSWQVISLDSNLSGLEMEAQLAWLRDELAVNPVRCTLAYWHHPLYSSGVHGNIATMRAAWDLLRQAGADIVLSAHDHDYERYAPQDADGNRDYERGIRQFVIGTGGAEPRPILRAQPNSEVQDHSRFGVLRLRLDNDSYEWEFMEASRTGLPDNGPPDRGAGRCH